MLIGFAGKAGAGKDTAAYHMLEKYGYKRTAFADPMKRALSEMMGWDRRWWFNRAWKDHPQEPLGISPRDLAISLGTDWGRHTVGEDIWVKLAMQNLSQNTAFTDVRFPNEAIAIDKANGIIIEINRTNNPHAAINHISEDLLPEELIDYVVYNDGSLKDLAYKLDEIVDNYTYR